MKMQAGRRVLAVMREKSFMRNGNRYKEWNYPNKAKELYNCRQKGK